MICGDMLGSDGRKALDACVKVLIIVRGGASPFAKVFGPGACADSWYLVGKALDIPALEKKGNPSKLFSIADIYGAAQVMFSKLESKEEPGLSVNKHRKDLIEEYRKATRDNLTGDKQYSLSEAIRRVRGCMDILFNKGDDRKAKLSKIYHCPGFWEEEPIDVFGAKSSSEGIGPGIEGLDDETVTANIKIEHGSGFIVHNHFIITNNHVIETYCYEPESHQIQILNEAIGELPCEVAYHDVTKDLVLLYCPDLDLEQSGIYPLKLSCHSLSPKMQIFSFGYPMSHIGKKALFVHGTVSEKTVPGHSMVLLNCPLNSGNSGGSVMCRVNGQIKVVGVATQKHFKETLTLDERSSIEKIQKSLQTRELKMCQTPESLFKIPEDLCQTADSSCQTAESLCQTPESLLTLKLFDALETHSHFNLSNALPGHLLIEFIRDAVSVYRGEYKEELAEIIE